MGKVIKCFINKIVLLIVKNIDDILIILGCGVLITALFLFVSAFWGLIILSLIMILFGVLLSKIPK
ncbi:hypothetical protein [Vallitalea guaymasensis]|uniref:hypothetical protein n=1 Tax=Vallitalea guaymasensis TaxID=1185412 RepID=UPI000DE4160F|nr:hypothetical protein [Vallitalea guaymasensis]